jgi:prenyltransferase beta subunit
LYRRKRWDVPAKCIDWLLTCHHADGGFLAIPKAPIPDLLSTAVSLHALSGAQVDLSRIKEPCLDYVDSLWSAEGGFHGNWTDHQLDCEYTYYGLLALGHLSL